MPGTRDPATPSSKVLLQEETPDDDYAIAAVKSPLDIQHDQACSEDSMHVARTESSMVQTERCVCRQSPLCGTESGNTAAPAAV